MNNYYLYFGRLSKEKGIINLVNAWMKYVVGHNNEWLFICGDGPEKETVENMVSQSEIKSININILGGQPRDVVFEYVSKTKAVIIPSIWYEAGPLTMIESFSMGIPVIVSDLGNLGYSVIEGVHGAKFDPLNPDSIVEAINRFNTYDYEKLRNNCLALFEEKYTKEKNKELFEEIYKKGKIYG